MSPLRAPFPWFGGKSRVAPAVWERFGPVPNYAAPFAGSLAVLLARPTPPRVETVNDLDCYLSNFWRALKHDPRGIAWKANGGHGNTARARGRMNAGRERVWFSPHCLPVAGPEGARV